MAIYPVSSDVNNKSLQFEQVVQKSVNLSIVRCLQTTHFKHLIGRNFIIEKN